MKPTTQQLTIHNYLGYSQVWKPEGNGDQGLFMVRVPSDLTEMTEDFYEQLMMLRVQWLIYTWMDKMGDPQELAVGRLTDALSRLNAQQVPPPLYLPKESPPGALIPNYRPGEAWITEWSETLVLHNETLRTRFDLQNGWTFPIPVQLPTDPTLQKAWQTEHDDEILLDIWLNYLTADLS